MRSRSILWLVGWGSIALALSTCKSSQTAADMEEYLPYTEKESIVLLPFRAHLDSIGHLLDQQLDSVLAAEGGAFSEGELEAKVKKLGRLELAVEGDSLHYQVPLELDLTYDAGLAVVSADGQVALDFSTVYQIDSSWNLQTRTELKSYDWLKKPNLKVGFVSLPGSLVADWVIRFGKKEVAQIIDQQIRENLPLRTWVSEAWNTIREPVLLEEDLQVWMVANPQTLAMSPVTASDRDLSMTLKATCKPFVQLGLRPDSLTRDAPLPPLGFFQPAGEVPGFSLFVRTSLPYEQAEALARDQFLGEEFSAGKRSVRIEDIGISGERDKLIVSLDMSGTYQGKVELSGRPVYREKGNRIVLKDLDYTLKTKNFLHKTAGWILKSTLRNRLQDELDFFLESNLGEWKDLLQDQLDQIELEEGMDLGARVDELKVENTFLTGESIVVDVGMSGNLSLQLNGF